MFRWFVIEFLSRSRQWTCGGTENLRENRMNESGRDFIFHSFKKKRSLPANASLLSSPTVVTDRAVEENAFLTQSATDGTRARNLWNLPLSATRRWKLPKGRTWKNSHTFPDFYFEQFSFFSSSAPWSVWIESDRLLCAPFYFGATPEGGATVRHWSWSICWPCTPQSELHFRSPFTGNLLQLLIFILPANNFIMFHSVHLLWVQVLLKSCNLLRPVALCDSFIDGCMLKLSIAQS